MNDQKLNLKELLNEPVRPGQEERAWKHLQERMTSVRTVKQRGWIFGWDTSHALAMAGGMAMGFLALGVWFSMQTSGPSDSSHNTLYQTSVHGTTGDQPALPTAHPSSGTNTVANPKMGRL